jgi:hypothetical protein
MLKVIMDKLLPDVNYHTDFLDEVKFSQFDHKILWVNLPIIFVVVAAGTYHGIDGKIYIPWR